MGKRFSRDPFFIAESKKQQNIEKKSEVIESDSSDEDYRLFSSYRDKGEDGAEEESVGEKRKRLAMVHLKNVRGIAAKEAEDDEEGEKEGERDWRVSRILQQEQLEQTGRFHRAIASSADGRYLGSGGLDRHIHLWDTRTQAHIQAFSGHVGPISCLSFRQGTLELFSASFDKKVKKWDVELRTSIHELCGHWSKILSMDCQRKDHVLTVGRDRTMLLYKVGFVNSLAFARSGKFLVAGVEQLIEDPTFIKMHSQRAVDRECTLVYNDDNNCLHPLEDAPPTNYYAVEIKFDGTINNDFRTELPLPMRYPSCTTPIRCWCATPISGYSNGLLLVKNKALIVLWNPILQKYKKVLSPSPLKGWVSRYALGYEPFSADYVILSWLQKGYEVFNWKSYSLKAERWKNTEEQWPMQYGMCRPRKAVSSNGRLYWLVFRLTSHPKDLVELLAFDIKTENFVIYRLPNQITFNHTQIDENQYICFDVQGKVWIGFQNQFWIMDESNYWTPFYRFELQEFGRCVPLLSYEDARWVLLKIDRLNQRWFDREEGQFWGQVIHFSLYPGYFQMVLGTMALLDGDKCEPYEEEEDYMDLPHCFHPWQ